MDHLKGKRYINLIRCSTDMQRDTSIPDQRLLLNTFADKNGMVPVGEKLLEGVTGSIPARRSDIEELMNRKLQKDDFDVLLVHDLTRFTRSGMKHGFKLEYDFEAIGVEVISAMDNLPDGEFGELIKAMKYMAGNEGAKSIAMLSARGSMSALQNGRAPHCKRPPYAIDRLYVGLDGTPHHIMRTLHDGSQQRLDPNTLAVLETLPPPTKGNHFKKQRTETIHLIPGEPALVAAVQHMFRRYFIDNVGYRQIGKELNDMGVLPSVADQWDFTSIKQILQNPTYTGAGIANKLSSARYFKRDADSPKAVKVDTKVLAKRKRLPVIERPMSEWVMIEHPALKDFLDPDVREAAMAEQIEILDPAKRELRRPPRKNKHNGSRFFLSGIIRSSQSDLPMRGQALTKGNRYYVVTQQGKISSVGTIFSKMVPAEPLEKAVIEAVRWVLANLPDMQERIRRLVNQNMNTLDESVSNLDSLMKQKQKLNAKLGFLIDAFDDMNSESMREKAATLKGELQRVERQIAIASSVHKAEDPEAIAKAVVKQIASLTEMVGNKDDVVAPATMKRLLSVLVEKFTIDLETRVAELVLRLPPWAMSAKTTADGSLVCLKGTLGSACPLDAYNENGLFLAKIAIRPGFLRQPISFHQYQWTVVSQNCDVLTAPNMVYGHLGSALDDMDAKRWNRSTVAPEASESPMWKLIQPIIYWSPWSLAA